MRHKKNSIAKGKGATHHKNKYEWAGTTCQQNWAPRETDKKKWDETT
jgi:hypothetical protein